MPGPLIAAAVQLHVQFAEDKANGKDAIWKNLNRFLEISDIFAKRMGLKMACISEFGLQGSCGALDRPIEQMLDICITVPGDETEAMAKLCKQHGMYLAIGAFEFDPKFPGRYFNSAILVGPDGDILLKSRGHTDSMQSSLTNTAPADIYNDFVAQEGEAALFPVVETEYGRIACLVGSDIMVPEIARCFSFAGAEVMLHLTADSDETWNMAKQLRAYENNAYLVSANCAGFYGSPFPNHLYQAGSHIFDYRGQSLRSSGGIGETIVAAPLDMEALRRHRGRVGGFNNLAELRTDLYAPHYVEAKHLPLDLFGDTLIEHRMDGPRKTQETVKRLQERGVFVAPAE